MFGLDPETAIRYAENARQLLTTAAEEHDPGGVAERELLRLATPQVWRTLRG